MTTEPDVLVRLVQGMADTPAAAALSPVLVRLGDLEREAGRVDAALAAYQAALTAKESAEARQGLGLCLLLRGEMEAAGVAFEAAEVAFGAAGLDGRAAIARANLATTHFARGQVERAAAGFRQAIDALAALGVADPELMGNLARCLARTDGLDEAIGWARDAVAAAHDAGQGRQEGRAGLLLGELLTSAGRVREALVACEHAVEASLDAGAGAGVAQGRLAQGALLYQLGRQEEAIASLEAALPLMRLLAASHDVASTLVNLGGIHFQAGDPAAALATLDEAAALLAAGAGSPLHTQLAANRGLALLASGRFSEAIADLERARQGFRDALQPLDEARQLAMLSNLHRYQGDLDAAIRHQRELMALEQAHGFQVQEPGGLLYAPILDRSLNVFRPAPTSPPVARSSTSPGPVLMVAMPSYGAFGPIFPRGATAVASFLQAHGLAAQVLPLAHHIDDFKGVRHAATQTRAVLADAIQALRPSVVGISAPFTYHYPRALDAARVVRELAPDTPILMGGPHVTYQDRECLRESPAVDIVVRGEGEWTALELVRALQGGGDLSAVRGITWRRPDGHVQRNPNRPLGDVAELPDIDFGLLPAAFCRRMEISAITSRGCTFRCRFCHEYRYWGGVARAHPVARILGEMERLGSRYGNRLQGIDDSMLDMRTPYFMDLVRQVGRSPWLPDNFGFLTRLDTITVEGVAAMRAAGIPSLSVGAESGSQRVLDAMNKRLTVEQTLRSLRIAAEGGVSTAAFFIIGHPGDNPEESQLTLDLVDRLFRQGLVSWTDLSIFTPYPGTPFFSHPERHGVQILTRDWTLWRRSNRPIAQLDGYSAGEIYLDYLRMLAVQARHLSSGR